MTKEIIIDDTEAKENNEGVEVDGMDIRAISMLMSNQQYINPQEFLTRIQGMYEAYIKFIHREIEDKDTPPNIEFPLLMSIGMTFINSIAATVGASGADKEFFETVRASVMEEIESDFKTHYEIGLRARVENENNS